VLYKFPLDAGTFGRLNSCGINPIDGVPYATAQDTSSGLLYIIRFDRNTVEWMAQLPAARLSSGAFTSTGDYWVAGGHRKMWKYENLHSLTGYATAAEASVGRDWSAADEMFQSSTKIGTDFVIIEGSFNSTSIHNYIVSARDDFVMLHRLDEEGPGWRLTPNSAAFAGSWGSAWLYDGEHFCYRICR
jgi:hypothetical protein